MASEDKKPGSKKAGVGRRRKVTSGLKTASMQGLRTSARKAKAIRHAATEEPATRRVRQGPQSDFEIDALAVALSMPQAAPELIGYLRRCGLRHVDIATAVGKDTSRETVNAWSIGRNSPNLEHEDALDFLRSIAARILLARGSAQPQIVRAVLRGEFPNLQVAGEEPISTLKAMGAGRREDVTAAVMSWTEVVQPRQRVS